MEYLIADTPNSVYLTHGKEYKIHKKAGNGFYVRNDEGKISHYSKNNFKEKKSKEKRIDMLSAKEKAKELVDKFNNIPSEEPCFMISLNQSKNCALICVDEILEATKKRKLKIKPNTIDFYWEYNEYYLEVKNEIEKL